MQLTPGGRQQTKVQVLRSLAVFSDLGEGDLAVLAGKASERRVRRDTVLLYENDPATTLYVIKRGQVKASKMSEDGREQILHVLGDGEFIGVGATLGHKPYPATVTTVVDSELICIDHVDFEAALRDHPTIAPKIIGILFERMTAAYELVRDMALQSVQQRTAALLLKMAGEDGRVTPQGTVITMNLSREELAEVIGSARETVIRSLSKFAKAHLIRIEKHQIVVLDEERLRLWAQM